MASRVNYMVVEDGAVVVASYRWGAYGVYRELDRGPERVLGAVARDQEQGGGPAWSDATADGGVLIDVDERRLTFFGNDLLGGIAVNRAYLRRLARRWTGWRVDWAYQGVFDLWPEIAADHERDLPEHRQEFVLGMRDWSVPVAEPWLYEGAPETNGHMDCELLSVRTADGTARWLYERAGPHPAWAGPELLARLPAGDPGWTEYRGIPVHGLHVDVPDRWVGVWTARWLAGTWVELGEVWSGWGLRAWEDRYEEHLAALDDGAPDLPRYDEDAAAAALGPMIEDPHRTR